MALKNVKAFVITTLLIVLLFGSCSTTKKLQKYVEQKVSVEQLMQSIGVDSYSCTYPLYYNTGAQWNERSLELIEQAQDYILVSTFLGVEHPSVYPVWKALADKAAEGVDVYIIVDSSSNFQMVPIVNERIQAAFMLLHELGLNFVEYNSLSLSNLFFIPKLLDRDHRKYWVVDGQTLAAGGVNINHTSVAWPPGYGNIDTMVELGSSQAIKEVVETFVATWNNYSTTFLDADSFNIVKNNESETARFWLLDHYWPTKSKITTLFDLFSIYATKELWMVQGYTFLTPALLKRIKFAVDRGVKVNFILSDYSTQPKYELASRYGILDLIEAGASVYMYHSPVESFLHAKIMVADGKLVSIGSANYNLRSQSLSRELNFLFEDERIGEENLKYIETLLKECTVVTKQEAESYRNFKSWYNHLLMQIWG